MKDLKQLLAKGDPIVREPEMRALDAQAMRRAIVVEVRRQPLPAPALSWPRPLVLGAALAACLAIGVSIGVRLGDNVPSVTSSRVVAPAAREDARRQLQMTSPGGTRIIWTFHENLEL
jgi:hypothetical protein